MCNKVCLQFTLNLNLQYVIDIRLGIDTRYVYYRVLICIDTRLCIDTRYVSCGFATMLQYIMERDKNDNFV